MGDLSWNPASWTPSNLAEELVEGLTGSEGLGDMAGLWAAGATGDIRGVADQSYDLGENVGKGLGKFVEGVWNAAKDAIEVFSNPGQVKAPSQNPGQVDGYAPPSSPDGAPIQQLPPTDVGPFDQGDSSSIPGKPDANAPGVNTSDATDFNFLTDPRYSLEDKIFMLLMKLQSKTKGDLDKELGRLKDKKTSGGADGKGQALDALDMTDMNRMTNDLSQLNTLTTNMLKLFKDMKDSVIQNIGR